MSPTPAARSTSQPGWDSIRTERAGAISISLFELRLRSLRPRLPNYRSRYYRPPPVLRFTVSAGMGIVMVFEAGVRAGTGVALSATAPAVG